MAISPAFSNAILWPTESPIKIILRKSHQSSVYRMLLVRLSGLSIGMRRKKRKKKKKRKEWIMQRKKCGRIKKKMSSLKGNGLIKTFSHSEDDIPLNLYIQKPTSLEDSLQVGAYVIVKYEGEYFPRQIKNTDD